MNYPDNYRRNNPKILKRIEKDIKENSSFHYLFMGVVGCGKTYLAEIILNNLKGFTVLHVDDFYDKHLRMLDNNESGDRITKHHDRFLDKSLFVDDIGGEKDTKSAHELFKILIKRRYRWWRNNRVLNTIYTTNLNSKKLANLYGTRVVSRLTEMFTVCKFTERDFRKDKAEVIS